jgi:hypothetical protein
MKNTSRKLNNEIRALANKLGWDVWMTYTDPRKGGKRVKFMRNGWVPSGKVQADVKLGVERLLKKKGLQRSHKVSWGMGESWRGPYVYLAMHVTAS